MGGTQNSRPLVNGEIRVPCIYQGTWCGAAQGIWALVIGVALTLCGYSTAAGFTPVSFGIRAKATNAVKKKPGIMRSIGLAEMYRAAGNFTTFQTTIADAASPGAGGLESVYAHTLLCWRMLPVAPAKVTSFANQVALLRRQRKSGPWLGVFELYLAHLKKDRKAMLSAARTLQLPKAFPEGVAEKAHFDLLRELGVSKWQAGYEVIAHRNARALRGLHDLHNAMSKNVWSLRRFQRMKDALVIEKARDELSNLYQKVATHISQKQFSLRLVGAWGALRDFDSKLKRVPFFKKPEVFRRLLTGMDQARAWNKLVKPCLENELKLLGAPPDFYALYQPLPLKMTVKSKHRMDHGQVTVYTGDVSLKLGNIQIKSGLLTVVHADNPREALVSGSSSVSVRGIPGFQKEIKADRFTYQAHGGTFTFSGHLQLPQGDGVKKYDSCTISADGSLVESVSLLDRFKAAYMPERKLALLPQITSAYDDHELPADVAYYLALDLLRPHLSWHALKKFSRFETEYLQYWHSRQAHDSYGNEDSWRWEEAHKATGDPWFFTANVPAVMKKRLSDAKKAHARRREWHRNKSAMIEVDEAEEYGSEAYSWRIEDPDHPDVKRAERLLEHNGMGSKGERWLVELRRNNTVLTADVVGAYSKAVDAGIVIDVRNVENISVSLYRVKTPKTLLSVLGRIGNDFMFRDYGLGMENPIRALYELEELLSAEALEQTQRESLELQPPDLKKKDLMHQWKEDPGKLKCARIDLDQWREWYGEDEWELDDEWDQESEYFGDHDERYGRRIRKAYRKEVGERTSWYCDRVLPVPGKYLKKAGAYILVMEANGQRAYVPLVVDPMSLVMRRCRDGVFALVSDSKGMKPVPGAFVYGVSNGEQRDEQMLQMQSAATSPVPAPDATADRQGAAFAKVFAGGDRAILAWDPESDRYSVGGFGDLFEGLFISADDREQRWDEGPMHARWDRQQRALLNQRVGHVYENRQIVAAYTDRPTFRPGQSVKFKLIVRQFSSAGVQNTKALGDEIEQQFRAEDFELASTLEIPQTKTPLTFAAINPKGRVVGRGTLTLNEFGTAAGEIALSEESATGIYALRVTIDGKDLIIPSIFAVKYYRRPNFELSLAGVDAELKTGSVMTLALTGRYYFGKTMSAGEVEVRLVAPGEWRALARVKGELDSTGHATLELEIPAQLGFGKYHIVASLTDDSGRTVSKSVPTMVKSDQEEKLAGWGLGIIPRFIAVNKSVTVRTHAEAVIATKSKEEYSFHANAKNEVKIKFSNPGWYVIKTEAEQTKVFVYGGTAHPRDVRLARNVSDAVEKQNLTSNESEPTWVNLSYYHDENMENPREAWVDDYSKRNTNRYERSGEQLMVLFGRQHANVGETLKVLAYIPYDEARVLFTFEGRTVVDYYVTDSAAKLNNYHVLEIPIKKRHLPNFYLGGRILGVNSQEVAEAVQTEILSEARERKKFQDVEDGSEDPRWCRVEVFDPNAKPGGQQLNISISTKRKIYRPGENVEVEMVVSGLDGEPKEAEVSLGAVDESVYSFGEDKVDWLARSFTASRPTRRYMRKTWRSFFPGRWLLEDGGQALEAQHKLMMAMEMAQESTQRAQQMAQQASQLEVLERLAGQASKSTPRMSRAHLLKFGALPVGEVPLARMRTDFRETATWQPQLKSNKQGMITTSFKVPDSLTAFRLTAVGLTKKTELGVGRSKIHVSLPLSIQLFLPRFAVEKDRLAAVALVHNKTDRVMDCKVHWEIKGAKLADSVANKSNPVKDTQIHMDTVCVQPNASKSVRLDLAFHRAGAASVSVRVGAGKEGDAEERNINVHAYGRSAEVVLSGTFEGSKTLDFPTGFVAQDLRVSLTRRSVSSAMDGLSYLVQYPYGCVEQTMSRFLPSVMVARAASQGFVVMPEDVANKLPDVLSKGLERLYNFQHEDGGWGWWKNDETNHRMTVYVVYGLARCKSTGTPVNAKVLGDACAFLQEKLRFDILKTKNAGVGALGVHDLVARAWLALALAGKAHLPELRAVANRALLESETQQETLCNLALACHAANENKLGERLWKRVKGWKPGGLTGQALLLTAQLEYGAPIKVCFDNSYKLLARRRGHRWGSTRTTAWAIEALAGMMRHAKAEKPATKIKITMDDKIVFNPRTLKELAKGHFNVQMRGDQLSSEPVRKLHLTGEFNEPGSYALTAKGYLRMDKILPTGTTVRMARTYRTLKGKPISDAVKVGKVIAVHVKLVLTSRQRYMMIDEPRPAGFEFADDQLHGALAKQAAHFEFRDDRLCAFFGSLAAGTYELIYYLRAETPGTSNILPGRAYPMYRETLRGETGADVLKVRG